MIDDASYNGRRPPHRVTACRSCGAPIIWAVSVHGKTMPLDAIPVLGGEFVLTTEGQARPVDELWDGEGVPRYRSHVVTCPNADEHRKRLKSKFRR